MTDEEVQKVTENIEIEITGEKEVEKVFPKQKYPEFISKMEGILEEVAFQTPFEIKQSFIEDELRVFETYFIPATRSFVSDFDDMRLDRISRFRYRRHRFENTDITLAQFSSIYRDLLRGFEYLDEFQELLKGSVEKRNERKILFRTKDNQAVIDIANISSGQKELFPLLLILQHILKNKQPHFLIIEEPEAHLFPKDQRLIFDTIIEIINQAG